jgi:uncharacterized membrane protein YfcA
MNCFKRFASPVVCMALVLFTVTPASSALDTPPRLALSPAVVQTTVQTVVAVYNHQKQGAVQPGDLASSATALRILFSYMQEQGPTRC